MKMAKASEADLKMAMDLCSALEGLIGWLPTVPADVARVGSEEDAERFYRDDREQCVRVLGHLLELAETASLMRVVWGAAVLLDPDNKMVDPDSDTLEHHPNTIAALEDAERLNWLDATNKRFSMGWRVGVAPAGNVNVSTVVLGKDGIRTAIDSAKAEIQQVRGGD